MVATVVEVAADASARTARTTAEVLPDVVEVLLLATVAAALLTAAAVLAVWLLLVSFIAKATEPMHSVRSRAATGTVHLAVIVRRQKSLFISFT